MVHCVLTVILSRTVSELSQLIVQILGTLRFWAPFGGLRDNVRCSSWAHWKARSGLPISVIIEPFLLGVTAMVLRANIGSK